MQVKNLSYVYSAGTPFEHKALDNVNFTIHRAPELISHGKFHFPFKKEAPHPR